MGSAVERSCKNVKFGNGSDRISSLPDPLLHHILSFLETKEVVRAGVLAKRWRGLWASIPTLDFKDCDSFHNHKFEFENFVDTVLLFHEKSSLDRFCLICKKYSDANHIIRWIRYAISRNTKVLKIKIPAATEPHFLLPQCVFQSQSLEELALTLNFNVDLSPPEFMSRLRKLTLSCIEFPDGFIEDLMLACPVLEELFLDYSFLGQVEISSTSLKRLAIIDQCDIHYLEISVPSLLSLTLLDPSLNDVVPLVLDLSSLLEATVTTHFWLQPLAGLVNAKTITWNEIQFSEEEEFSEEELLGFPTFNKLESLTLKGKYTTNAVQLFACFLLHSPNLKTYDFFGKTGRIV